jgi:hypothetical protein
MALIQLREELATAQHRGKRSRIWCWEAAKLGSAMELHKSDTLQNKIDFPSIRKNVIFCKEKENLFFSIKAVKTKLEPFSVTFLWAARCQNVPWLAYYVWCVPGELRTHAKQTDWGEESSMAGLWASQIPGCTVSGLPSPFKFPMPFRPDYLHLSATLSHLCCCPLGVVKWGFFSSKEDKQKLLYWRRGVRNK